MSDHRKEKMASVGSVFRLYSGAVSQYPFHFILSVVGVAATQVTALIIPLILRDFFNVLSTNTPSATAVHQLFFIIVILSALWILEWVFYRIKDRSVAYVEAEVMRDLFSESFGYLIEHSHHFFISNFAGSLTHKVNKFSRAFETLFDAVFFEFFPTAIFVTGAVFVLFLHNHLLGTMLGLWVIIFTTFQIYVAQLRQPSRIRSAEADTRMTAVLADSISNHSTITLFSGEKFEESYVRSTADTWYQALVQTWTVDNYIWAGLGMLIIVIEIGLMYGATIYWGRGLLTIGDFVLIQSYLLSTFIQLMSINRSLRRFYDALANAQEMTAILQEPHEVQDRHDAQTLAVSRASIDFKEVEFHFHAERPVLAGFNLSIRGGEKVALVGPSGAGKSTITKLLLRLYDVSSGSIEIDRQNIARVTQESLRNAIGFVPQEPVLFHRSLLENIRYGRRDASDEEVYEAARKAHCHEFISGLTMGYDTLVGERGVKLSGGERQRVAIARAILKDAPILVLDEATSSLDSESESLIQDSLKILMEGKTVLVIAHRLSTIMNMDRIVVLENGAMVAQGTHQELIERGGLYQKLWSIQAGGFIPDEEE